MSKSANALPILFPFTLCSLLVVVQGLVCRKEKISPLGLNFGAMNVECGQYVQHCLKVFMWDGTIIRDCDPLALCPHDGSKVIKNAHYFCCVGNVCNGKVIGRMRRLQLLLIIFIGQILHILIRFN
ncbi:hypothetical protein GPALN_001911 [Globodera pallida]|nr:hypothetical protein GPALN_001911 [Globodera pallida]